MYIINLAVHLFAFQTSSHYVSSFSFHHLGNGNRRISTTTTGLPRKASSPLLKLYTKRPRSLVPTESDLEDSQLVSAPFLIDTNSIIDNDEQDANNLDNPSISTTSDDVNDNPLLKRLFLGIDPTPDVIGTLRDCIIICMTVFKPNLTYVL